MRSCFPELIRASPITRRNRTIRQRCVRNSYSRLAAVIPPHGSSASPRASSASPDSFPAAISWKTGRNSNSRWNAMPSETQTNVELMTWRTRGAPLVGRREEDLLRMIRERVDLERGARGSDVHHVRRRLDDLRRVVRVDRDDVPVGNTHRRPPNLVQEREDLIGSQPATDLQSLRDRLGGWIAAEFLRGPADKGLEMGQLSPEHPEARRLHLRRRLVVIPEVPQRAGVGPRSAELRPGLPEQRVRLVERPFGSEAAEIERLGVPRVRGPERPYRRSGLRLAELRVHGLEDLREPVARELHKGPHPGRASAARLRPPDVERFAPV